MRPGLAQLVPYTECQYPEVLPGPGLLALETVINSSGPPAGVGDYLDPFNWPIPQYLEPGNINGLGCADCGGSCGGLGDDGATGGLFNLGVFTSLDPTTWGAGEYGVLAAAALLLYFVTHSVNRVERSYRSAKGRVKGRAKKIKKGFS
jgi:hypothetical protein